MDENQQPNQETPQQPNQPTRLASPNKPTLYAVGALVIIAAVAAGACAYQQNTPKEKVGVSQVASLPIASVSPSASASSQPTASASAAASASASPSPSAAAAQQWKAYANAEVGIRFEYPAELGSVLFSQKEGAAVRSSGTVPAGKLYKFVFSDSAKVISGLVTSDYEAPKSAEGFEIRSFSFDGNGKCRYSYSTIDAAASTTCEPVRDANGVDAYIAPGDNYGTLVLFGFVPTANTGAYPAYTFVYPASEPGAKANLTHMLSSFAFGTNN